MLARPVDDSVLRYSPDTLFSYAPNVLTPQLVLCFLFLGLRYYGILRCQVICYSATFTCCVFFGSSFVVKLVVFTLYIHLMSTFPRNRARAFALCSLRAALGPSFELV
ncbi:hypothetical protein EDB89DRAFT_1569422 [Lactarius sanguifluus]|nr:hypothetical protein EDB89DRAFT_1569422 [Lactarius sanguifluus]